MAPKYEIGQKVIITLVKNHYYCIRPNTGEVFYIYIVRMEFDRTEITLHEDELASYIE